jgi:hypothetical protein
MTVSVQRSFLHPSLGSEQFKESSSDRKVGVLCFIMFVRATRDAGWWRC